MIEIDFVEYLKKNEKLVEVLGGNRIYPGTIPSGVSPAIAYFQVAHGEHHNIPVSFPTYQFSCFSQRIGEAKVIREIIRDAFKGRSGEMGNTRVIQGSVTGQSELYENDTKLHNAYIDIKISHWED